MSAADRIVQEYRVRKRRFTAAVSAVELLSTEQRKELIVVLVDRVESETCAPRVAGPSGAASPEPSRRRSTERRGTKTERAEALVRERPGMTASQIAELIGQNRPAADSTLRSIKLRRGTIERRDGRWYPVSPNSGGSDPAAN